ncbi:MULTISPECIES: hypothetical protein [unclassified Micromonospora]|uniref:hypothetical protein n=1 Tax=unclassified Micromonospora TaxID=2617518 RepID=UPI0024170964|nr:MULTISPECIES: hypothetical protein [unclassified Micromonospora]MDG4814391.1 hypothetical protein [Micromonospora sp. WMMD956]WFE57062.1 hypothetical protein O7633_09330 [Micromonospora sp. WMMD712]
MPRQRPRPASGPSRALRVLLGVAAGLAVLLAGCRSPERAAPAPGGGAPAPEPPRPDWRALTLPTPPGAPGRLLLRDAAACGGRWFVVGAVVDAAGVTRPAAWSSPVPAGSSPAASAAPGGAGFAWSSLRLASRTAYGAENVLTAVGCRDGRLAAVGAKSGGVHGNPRISTWRQLADGSVVEVPAEFEVFGGPDAVNVGRIAGGPAGWVVAGNRGTGAAAWSSADGREFRLVSGVPELASDAAGRTWAADVTAAASGWVLVGSVRAPGRPGGDPAVWVSPDGVDWRRLVLTAGGAAGDLQRVVRAGERLVAVGRRGDALAAWVRDAAVGGEPSGPAAGGGQSGGVGSAPAGPGVAQWRPGGALGPATGGAGQVAGLAAVDGGVVAVVLAAAGASAWFSADGGGWASVPLPVALAAAPDRSVAVAGAGDRLLLLVDGGAEGARLWSARVAGGPG